jgi:hypothetical protein
MPKQIVRIDGRMAIDGAEHRLQPFPNRSIPASSKIEAGGIN